MQFLDHVEIFGDLCAASLESFPEIVIVGVGDGEELVTTGLHSLDGGNDIVGSEGDVLNTGTTIKVDVFLDLGLSLAGSWLVDWHFDILVKVSNNHRSQCRVLSVEHLVINGPKSMEIKHFLIPGCSCFHLSIWLISNAMIDKKKIWGLKTFDLVKWLR